MSDRKEYLKNYYQERKEIIKEKSKKNYQKISIKKKNDSSKIISMLNNLSEQFNIFFEKMNYLTEKFNYLTTKNNTRSLTNDTTNNSDELFNIKKKTSSEKKIDLIIDKDLKKLCFPKWNSFKHFFGSAIDDYGEKRYQLETKEISEQNKDTAFPGISIETKKIYQQIPKRNKMLSINYLLWKFFEENN